MALPDLAAENKSLREKLQAVTRELDEARQELAKSKSHSPPSRAKAAAPEEKKVDSPPRFV
jgi:hypothetical protein